MCFSEVFARNYSLRFLMAICFSSVLITNRTNFQKCSSLKKLAEKGCWDVAEIKTNSDRQLVEYLVSSSIDFS